MAHDELLELIAANEEFYGDGTNRTPSWTALRAVVELHKPHIITDNDGYKWFYCTICTDGFAPCTTIQAIEKEITYHD